MMCSVPSQSCFMVVAVTPAIAKIALVSCVQGTNSLGIVCIFRCGCTVVVWLEITLK